MSAWVSAAPVIGTRSLDGFAIGALMSGACALAITASRSGGRDGRAAGGYRSRHRRGDPIPGRVPRDGASAGIVFPDAELALVPFAGPRRPEARRLPRHAAPSVGLGSRITGSGGRMTGLFATRALASGAGR